MIGDLVAYELPVRVKERRADVHRPSTSSSGPGQQGDRCGLGSTRPHRLRDPRRDREALPRQRAGPAAGQGSGPAADEEPQGRLGVRVSVVDTGWYAAAETDPDTPWLARRRSKAISSRSTRRRSTPYAGHGTFVAGVIRCLAPATYIEVEGVLTRAGAVYESEITKELNEAMSDQDKPDLISISAGCHTRNNLGLLGFEALAAYYNLTEGEGAVLVVAAAGNDSTDRPFWPAAYDWVVSVGALDADMCVSDFSNFGPWVDVYAHGRDLVNAFPTGTYTCHGTAERRRGPELHRLAQWSGTSFATPDRDRAIAAHMSEHSVSARDAFDGADRRDRPRRDSDPGGLQAASRSDRRSSRSRR